jgi:hypothetical protein
MQQYGNYGGDSGVAAFEIGSDSITVEFSDGATYLYNYQVTGSANVEEMKRLALSGTGLNSYINRHVRKAYAMKLS